MKNINSWKPTKYILKNNTLKANSDENHVNLTSRLLANKIASFYNYAIPKYAKGHLLDLGCGNAPLYVLYKSYSNNITCVDWKNTTHKKSHLDFELDLNLPLDKLKDNEYDTIILSDVLEHIRHPEKLCAEIFRILKPNGTLLLNVPFYYNLHEKPFDYYRYTEFALNSMFKDAGFEILEINSLGGTPEIIADLTSKLLKKIPLIGIFFSRFYLFICKLLFKLNLIKKLSKSSEKTFPYAYSLIAVKK